MYNKDLLYKGVKTDCYRSFTTNDIFYPLRFSQYIMIIYLIFYPLLGLINKPAFSITLFDATLLIKAIALRTFKFVSLNKSQLNL